MLRFRWILLLTLLVACNGSPNAVNVQITQSDPLNLSVGQTSTLTATVGNSNNQAVTWTSNNPSIASVGAATGAVQAIAAGTASITARSVADSSKTDSITVKVTAPNPNPNISVSINPNTAIAFSLIGDSRKLSATVSGSSNQAVVWTVRDDSSGQTVSLENAVIAWVDSQGMVTALGPSSNGGVTTPISVVATSVADPSKSASISVSVNPSLTSQTIAGNISIPPIVSQGAPMPTAEFVPGEVIVKFKPRVSLQSLQSLSVGGVSLQQVRALSQDSYLYRANLGLEATWQTIQSLSNQSDVLYAEPNYILRAQQISNPNDPEFSRQWNLPAINMPGAWAITNGSASTVIAVIDTGIASNHPDLAPKLLSGYDFISDPQVSDDNDGRDSNPSDPNAGAGYHGSHVAGIAAAASNNAQGIAGVNWNAKIVPVRVLSANGGTTADTLDAIRWASGIHINGVQDNANPAQVINMSLGGQFTCNNSYQEALNDALAKGVIVVVAAGNSNIDASRFTPASCAGVITVGATNKGSARASYSNFGSRIDVMAPGGEPSPSTDGILSTVLDGSGNPIYGFLAGTSMAAPHITGVIALMKGQKSGLTAAEALSILKSTANASLGNCGAGCGSGLINAQAALNALTPPPPPATLSLGASPKTVYFQGGQGSTQSATVTLNLTRGNFPDSVTFNVLGLPSGVTASAIPATAGNSATLTLNAAANLSASTSTVTITASGGSLSATTTIQLIIQAPATPPQTVTLESTTVYPCVIKGNICFFISTPSQAAPFTITDKVSSANYTLHPVFGGKYAVYALKDVDKNGQANPGDYNTLYTENGTPKLVSPPASGINLVLGPILSKQASDSGQPLQFKAILVKP